MALLDWLHQQLIPDRRIRILARHLADAVPHGVSVLDVGAGDGRLAAALLILRPDLQIRGVEVLMRPGAAIPIAPFDGSTLPVPDRGVDVVMMVDVLHHTDDPMVLLREAARVASHSVVIKDHDSAGALATPTLRFMDEIGNRRHGVRLPFNFWPRDRWQRAWDELGLRPTFSRERLGLYPFPANLLFDRSLHFVTRLERSHEQPLNA